jgi:hypothetical protein
MKKENKCLNLCKWAIKIQVFSGDSEKAKKILNDCKQDFEDLDGTIVFNTPNYKVWVGNFRTRIEAERNLIEIRKQRKCLLLKPRITINLAF